MRWFTLFELSSLTGILSLLTVSLLTILAILSIRTKRLSTLPGPYRFYNIFGALLKYASKGVINYDKECIEKYGRVYGDWLGSVYTMVTTDVDIIREVFLKEARAFPTGLTRFHPSNELQKHALPFIYDYARWRRIRSIVTPTFSSAKLKLMSPFMQQSINRVTEKLMEGADERKELEMKEMFGAYTMKMIASAAFGIDIDPLSDPNNVFTKNATGAINSFLGNFLAVISSWFPLIRPMAQFLSLFCPKSSSVEFLDEIVKESLALRRSAKGPPPKDLLQLLIDARATDNEDGTGGNKDGTGGNKDGTGGNKDGTGGNKDGTGGNKDGTGGNKDGTGGNKDKKTLSEIEIRSQALVFLLAGYETTATTLCFMSYLLATNPEIQDKLCQEIDEVLKGEVPDYSSVQKLPYLEMCIHESMRVFPPVLRAGRRAAEDISIKGYFIPKNTGVSVPVHALHHDPEYWPEPDRVIPERFSAENRDKIHPCAYAPFSLGPKSCVGKRLALMAVKVGMTTVLQKVKFTTTSKTQIPLQIKKGMFIITATEGIHLQTVRR